jgi:hypothetical protein
VECLVGAQKKQSIVAQSTAEAEYISAAAGASHGVWLRKLLDDLQMKQEDPTIIMVDNKAAISIARNPVDHGRTKHTNVKFHYLWELQKNGEVELVYCHTEEQLADIFTKAIPGPRMEVLKRKLGMTKRSFKEEC